jgi:flagellar protein FliO/FliZ
VVVLGILTLAARYAGKRGMGGAPRRTATHVEVVARQGIGRGSSVVVVRAAERALVLGVTESSISLLADADVAVLELPTDAPGIAQSEGGPLKARPAAWKDTLEHLRERTVRRS